MTARVVGTLSDETIAALGGSVETVRERFPWVVPIRQTAVHTVREEEGRKKASQRERRGEVESTMVRDLPPGTIMIVYPVSIANQRRGYNTLAGDWRITLKVAAKKNNEKGSFGFFPFLLYTGSGHALHGPITVDDLMWELRRGEVSHGCNRMEGEHVVELATLLGCTLTAAARRCPRPGAAKVDIERVTVMEEWDHIPDPERRVLEGAITSWSRIDDDWVVVDTDYPRDPSSTAYIQPTSL